MRGQDKILPEHRSKKAYVYVRQSVHEQVLEHQESGRRQRELAVWVQKMGWPPSAIVVLDSDQAKTGQSSRQREDYKQLVGDVCLGEVGLVVGLYLSRLSRNNADWFPLIEMCALDPDVDSRRRRASTTRTTPMTGASRTERKPFPRRKFSVFTHSFMGHDGVKRVAENFGDGFPRATPTMKAIDS